MTVASTGYMTVAEFRVRTIMPQAEVDVLESREPDFLQTTLNDCSEWVNARLQKRYATPFVAPYPAIVLMWVVRLATPIAYGKLGWQPSSESDAAAVLSPATEAKAEIKEAADSKEGLFELPLRQDTTATGVSRGAPICYTETSPYVWADIQLENAEDR